MSDGQAELLPADGPPRHEGRVEGERHVSEVAGRPPALSRRAGIGVMIAGTAIACGAILLSEAKPRIDATQAPPLPVRQVVSYEPPPAGTAASMPALPPPPPPPLPPPTPPVPAPRAHAPATPAVPASSSRLLVYTSGIAGSATRVPAPGVTGLRDGTTDGSLSPGAVTHERSATLQARLAPARLAAASATVLRHQPYLLTMGTLVSCILQTAMDSTLPGLVTCVVPQDVLGRTGLTLLDRGTRVVGEFRGGVRPGDGRLFVVWTRAETPRGVVIDLDSPAADPLGRSGMAGDVDRRFWQRFGGALLLTTVEGAIQAGVAAVSKEGTTTIHTGPAQAVIAEALRGSITLPPTIRKQPGELVSLLVARDLDFSDVYGVQARQAAPGLPDAEGPPP